MAYQPDDDASLRVEVRFKNARLIEAIRAQNVPLLSATRRGQAMQQLGPIRGFCRVHDLPYQAVLALCTLRTKPLRVDTGAPRRVVEQLSEILDHPIAWLFPADLYKITWPRAFATNVAPHRFVALTEAPVSLLALPPTQDDNVAARELREVTDAAIATLTPREQQVVRARFGLDGPPQSMSEVAAQLPRSPYALDDPGGRGITVERVRQIEAKALRKLRHPSRSRALAPHR